MQSLSSDAFSCSMVAISVRKAAAHDSVGEPRSTRTIKDLRVLLVRRKESALRHIAEFSSLRKSLISRLSNVSFVSSPSFIAVDSDSPIEPNATLRVRVLSPVFFLNAKKSRGHHRLFCPHSKDSATLNLTEELLPGHRIVLHLLATQLSCMTLMYF
jgi:hypothetical protein